MILSIHVRPNSKVDQIEVDQQGGIKVKIRAQPVDGKANEYLQAYLASVFKVPKSQVKILKGAASSHKKVEIVCSEQELTAILHNFKKP